MTDNKPMEEQAESSIKAQLLKYHFNISKPFFDKYGGDLLILENPENKLQKILRVQCKGRRFNGRSLSVIIPCSYVDDSFVLFIYVVDERINDNTYVFFPEDIRKWRIKNDKYVFRANSQILNSDDLRLKVFDAENAEKVKELLLKSSINEYTTIIIDAPFLEKALKNTKDFYQQLYPDKIFIKPGLQTVVQNILNDYDIYKSESKTISCYIFVNSTQKTNEWIDDELPNSSFPARNKIHIHKTYSNGSIENDAIQTIERLVNNQNIILVADNRLYEEPLNEFFKKGVQIICVMLSEPDASNMFINFQWGDINYPLGISLGLNFDEL